MIACTFSFFVVFYFKLLITTAENMDFLNIVLFSYFIPVCDVVFSLRRVNRTCKAFTNTFFKSIKRSVYDLKWNIYSESAEWSRCNSCGKTRRCISDPFDCHGEMTCLACQPKLMSLTEARRYIDHRVLQCISQIKKSGCTFFLKNDIAAFDYIFDGPNDRQMFRDNKKYYINKEFKKLCQIECYFESMD